MTKPCSECGGHVGPLNAALGLYACQSCGKPVIPSPDDESGEEAAPAVEPGTDLNAPIPASEVGPLAEGDVLIPDYFEVIVGWRAWDIVLIDGRPRLQSAIHDAYWFPRRRMEAVCSKERSGTVPHEGCTCGLYTARSREHLAEQPYYPYDPETDDFTVIGKVNLWGKVIEGSQGWKSQYGYPAELILPYEAWRYGEALREDYGVKVTLDNYLDPQDEE